MIHDVTQRWLTDGPCVCVSDGTGPTIALLSPRIPPLTQHCWQDNVIDQLRIVPLKDIPGALYRPRTVTSLIF